MRVKIQQFLFGKSHSWSIVGQNIGRSLLKLGHDVEFISTDGFEEKYCPKDLFPHVRNNPEGEYDCQVSYTAPHNWAKYFRNGDKNRFAIWNFEYKGKGILPGMAKYNNFVDCVLPSSHFTKQVFLDMGIPENRMVVVPHGINLEDYQGEGKWPLKTNKSKKILLNLAQPHKRKAIPLALESYGKAFSSKDDVALVCKVITANKQNQNFDVNFFDLIKRFRKRFPKHAEINVVDTFIPDISDIYRSCDVNFSATHTECWHLPSLEAIACGLVNVVPRYGGMLDFCNDDNCLFIDGKEVIAPRDHLYWDQKGSPVHFKISTDDAADKLQKAVRDNEVLKQQYLPAMKKTAEQFTWENVAKQIISMTNA